MRSKQVKENDVILAISEMPVVSAPLEMVVDMLAHGDDIVVDLAHNVYGVCLWFLVT